jgi:acyl-coenzyme A synthetase/AMP-(fatty) acid ligase
MCKNFLVFNGEEFPYEKLIEDLNSKTVYSPYLYIKDNNPYEIFLSILHSLINCYSIVILDGDFSFTELEGLEISRSFLSNIYELNKIQKINDVKSFVDTLIQSKDWTLTLYTSGTTGKPKKVTHNFNTLMRNVKINETFKGNIWAFAYNPTHIAGLQVFFQAILNLNTIVYSFDDYRIKLANLIEKYKITNISATPTYYRNVLPFLEGKVYESVKRITFGGEKYDSSLEITLRSIFPNAKIRNIYASTEAGSLFIADGDLFNVPDSISELIKINKNNQLLVHYSLLGESESFSYEDNWYNTGDIVEIVDQSHFRFVSRQSNMINVGGYKVNPVEVEEILLKVEGVIDLRVYAKENRVTGELLVVDVVKDPSINDLEIKKAIKQYAAQNLQRWKIPRIVNIVNDIPTTRTGKKVRK